jgi:alkylhydroperoxidase family enzyme
MTLINTVSPQKAEGDIKKGYAIFLNRGSDVPNPIRMLSASPGYFNLMIERNKYYANHPALSFSLLAHIRYLVSKKIGNQFCAKHNQKLLVKQGLSEEDLERMGMDADKSLLEDHERLMLDFVLRAMDDPHAISKKDIELLHEAGWEDRDILDATAQAIGMVDHTFFKDVFKPDF